MSSFRSQLGNKSRLFLDLLQEVPRGGLRVELLAGLESEDATGIKLGAAVFGGLHRVQPQKSERIEVTFESYIAYAVRNESFVSGSERDAWDGNAFRIYSRSAFLDFLRHATSAAPAYPGPFAHYAMLCENHWVDVASAAEPNVNVLRFAPA